VSFERLSWLLVAFACACQRQPRDEQPPASQPISSASLRPETESTSIAPLPGLTSFELPDAANSGSAPALLVGADELHLAFIRSDAEPSLEHAILPLQDGARDDSRWSETQRIAGGPRVLANWADVPAIGETASGRTVVAWSESHGDDPAAGYAPRVAAQQDDGSFGMAWSPDDIRRGPESGFVAFASAPDGLHMFWLDGRELGGPGHAHAGGTMQLRSVAIDDEGQQAGPSSIVDERTCECCKLGVGLLGGQPLAAYRDRSDIEVRDIYVAGPSITPTLVAQDGWTITGCPVNGPAVASSSDRMYVAWFTGAQDRSAMYLASASSPVAWSPAKPFDLGLPGGRVELIATPDAAGGGVLVSWVELDAEQPGRAKLLARRVRADGGLGAPHAVAEFGAARDWGFPRAALLGDEVIWIYTDPTGKTPRLRAWLARLPLPP
jgi:hypothetical protein